MYQNNFDTELEDWERIDFLKWKQVEAGERTLFQENLNLQTEETLPLYPSKE